MFLLLHLTWNDPVYLFSRDEKDDFERQVGKTPLDTEKKVGDVTGVSKSTVIHIRKEAEACKLKSPGTVLRNKAEGNALDSLQFHAALVPCEEWLITCIYR